MVDTGGDTTITGSEYFTGDRTMNTQTTESNWDTEETSRIIANDEAMYNRAVQLARNAYSIKRLAHLMKQVFEDASRARCGTFKSLNNICKFIAAKEDIPESKVYPALRMIGYNIRYHNMKGGDLDPLHKIGDVVKECILTADTAMIEFATTDSMFDNITSAQYRMRKDVIAIAMKDAEHSGIKVSELNMYNVLEGINTLVLNEPDYILLRDERIFRTPLELFGDIKNKLQWKYDGLKTSLSERRI